MFERYTERARRTIFFARYEASTLGSAVIETEHLLLGMMREERGLVGRFTQTPLTEEAVRGKVMSRQVKQPLSMVSVDLPLSDESKRTLAYAAEEAMRMTHQHIGTEHLLLGMLREERCFAGEMLRESGLTVAAVREQVRASALTGSAGAGGGLGASAGSRGMGAEVMRVLTFAAEEAKAGGGGIRAGHLLLGLLREEGSPVAGLLQEKGLRLEEVRERVRWMSGADG